MKIFFYNKGPKNLGTQRIYIKNLSKWLKVKTKLITIGKSLKKGQKSIYNVKILQS